VCHGQDHELEGNDRTCEAEAGSVARPVEQEGHEQEVDAHQCEGLEKPTKEATGPATVPESKVCLGQRPEQVDGPAERRDREAHTHPTRETRRLRKGVELTFHASQTNLAAYGRPPNSGGFARLYGHKQRKERIDQLELTGRELLRRHADQEGD